MFCPKCKAEYREGFMHCADCGLPLLPESRKTTAEHIAENPDTNTPSSEDNDPYCAFWEGEDARIFAEVCGVLDEEGIPYRALRHDSQIFRFSPNSKMKIGVPFSQFEKAGRAIVEAFGGATETRTLSWPSGDAPP